MVRTGYSLSQIVLHWLIAILVLFQLLFGESMTSAIDAAGRGRVPDPFDQLLADFHYWVGLAILVLVLVRLALRIAVHVPEPTAGAPGWMRSAARFSHALFYVLLVAMPALGLLAFYVGDPFGDIHSLGKPVFIVLIAIHAIAALFHQFWLKDGTLRRMFVPAA